MRGRERKGMLRYDHDLDRWCFDEGDQLESLHCGEVVAVRIADRFLWGRFELDADREWYCVMSGRMTTTISLRKGERYEAKRKW